MAGKIKRRPLDSIHKVNHEPRKYAPGVILLDRRTFDLDQHPKTLPSDVENWLLGPASKIADAHSFIEEFACRLAQAGLGVERLILNVGTLHPQAYGYAWHWNTLDDICDEIQISEDTLLSDAFRKNPICRVIVLGENFRVKLPDNDSDEQSPLMKELAAAGFTEYVALPLSASGEKYNALTMATRQPGGFSDKQCDAMMRLIDIFALHVERHIISRIAKNISYTYLGREAGEKVVSGAIKRGSGVTIHSIVWSSDMRDFSKLSEHYNNRTIADVLNNYFSVMAEAVLRNGGDVLKFVGDGMLAVFPFAEFTSPSLAAQAAAIAAREAVQDLALLNQEMANASDWPQLRTGIGLHQGEVFFGNIGANRRLDFTVIGQAVNIASRVEGLCKPLKRNILMSASVANLLHESIEPLGTHRLEGMQKSENIYALMDNSDHG